MAGALGNGPVIQTDPHVRTHVVMTEWHTSEERPVPTLVDPIAAKLERLEAKPALVLDEVDYGVRDRDGCGPGWPRRSRTPSASRRWSRR